jgi:oligopeptide/dipeptide ABC transporter ATP-binding protein
MSRSQSPILEAKNVRRFFSTKTGLFGEANTVRALDGVSFSVEPGKTFGIVGESGCGKTTLGKILAALERPTDGMVLYNGEDVHAMRGGKLKHLRRDVQIIFQDPYASLDPRMTVSEILSEPFIIHGEWKGAERPRRLLELAERCGIAQSHLSRYPHEFSGGQRQRVGIARALALNPKLVVCDEPVSALDVSIQAQILNLLKDLQKELGLTYIFISHDFSVVRHLCDQIAVMYLGKIVELATAQELFTNPQHPYTEALLSAIPIPDPERQKKRNRIILSGDIPSPLAPPPGCSFNPRCRYAKDACRQEVPALTQILSSHWLACPVLPFIKDPSETAQTNSANAA